MTLAKKQVASDSAQYCVIAAPFGRLGILTELVDGSLMLSKIEYLPISIALVSPRNQLAKEAEKQLKAYFQNPHHQFDLPMKPSGTEHQQRVWKSIQMSWSGQIIFGWEFLSERQNRLTKSNH